MRRALLPALAAVSLASTAAIAPAANAPKSQPTAKAAALVVQVIRPAGAPTTGGLAQTRRGKLVRSGAFAFPADGSLARVAAGASSAEAASTDTRAGARAVASTGAISLLGGLVTATSVRATATASASNGKAQEGARADVRGLIVAGRAVGTAPNSVIRIPDVGSLTVAEVVETVRASGGRRGFVIALHLRLKKAYRAYPAGTEVLVGYADAGAAAPRPPAPPAATAATTAPATSATTPPSGGSDLGHDTSRTQAPPPGGFTHDPPIDAGVRAQLLSAEYVFPVVGGAGFSDDFGGPRADTGFHQGVDLFSANGTPLVAVHDGTLFRVGWNRLGGNRLWLDDGHGNLFYYAHLSGYAEVAKDGAQVRAGDVIGFMGATGDAQGTPFHLHFEIHPQGGWAVPPIAYIGAWQGATPGVSTSSTPAVPVAAVGVPPASTAPSGGVEPTGSEDISSLSGLDDAALRRLGAVAGEGGRPVSQPDALVAVTADALPGFLGLR